MHDTTTSSGGSKMRTIPVLQLPQCLDKRHALDVAQSAAQLDNAYVGLMSKRHSQVQGKFGQTVMQISSSRCTCQEIPEVRWSMINH